MQWLCSSDIIFEPVQVKKFTSTFSWIQVGRGSVHLEVRQGVEREKGWGQDPVQGCARRHLQGGNFKAKNTVVLLFVFISLWHASLYRVRVWETSWWSVFNPMRASIARWQTLCSCICICTYICLRSCVQPNESIYCKVNRFLKLRRRQTRDEKQLALKIPLEL